MINKPRILLVENFGSDFWISRISIAKMLIEKGYEVHALIPNDGFGDKLRSLGIIVNSYSLNRSNKGLIQVLRLFIIYRRLIIREKFDIIHSFRFQPNLICSLAVLGIKDVKLIIHITGLGIAFSSSKFKYQLLRFLSQLIYIFKFFISCKIIVQNPDDRSTLWASSFFPNRITLIEGSGVDIDQFVMSTSTIRNEFCINKEILVFTCVTRLIWEKGIHELIIAFNKLKLTNANCVLLLVGWPDLDNPQHVPLSYFESLVPDGNIKFLGKRQDIVNILSGSDCFIYPSYYREGVPRSVMEALSVGLPIITTDTPGCRLTVENNTNGLLIAPKSFNSIHDAVNILSQNKSVLLEMAKSSRHIAENKFSTKLVISKLELIYGSLLK